MKNKNKEKLCFWVHLWPVLLIISYFIKIGLCFTVHIQGLGGL